MKNIHKINKNIYITSDSDIKEGDWCIDNGIIYQIKDKNHLLTVVNFGDAKKIILTTDQDLINDGIEQISENTLLKIVEHINSGKNIESFDEL